MSPAAGARGPLAGVRVVELGGLGPGPFCGMMLADLGAEVIRVDRPAEAGQETRHPVIHRGRTSIAVDLKHPEGADAVRQLIGGADAVIEGFRPGAVERLGLGPGVCLASNPKLVYGRMTGWGQDGPLAQEPGHDINYIALAGALHAIAPAGGDPVPPVNLVGDFGGGRHAARPRPGQCSPPRAHLRRRAGRRRGHDRRHRAAALDDVRLSLAG
ncbi:CoA transferase [Streptomyces sp. NPDC056689]|uniref:CoA transferase n=1 Tax=unclassified Streptomyces TaxID=2593676 RepID=UPI0036379554